MKKAIFLDIDGTLLDCLGGITDITPKVNTLSSSKRGLRFYCNR